MEFLHSFVFPSPSPVITVMSALMLMLPARSAILEATGKNLEYSKFGRSRTKSTSSPGKKMVPSRFGFLCVYIPTFLASALSLWAYCYDDSRICLVTFAFSLMFLKRITEVLFVHKYSGQMAAKSLIQMFLGYFLSTVSVIYTQKLNQGFQEPSIDLRTLGGVLFLAGILGNFYHNYLLSGQRENEDDKEYKIPKGGLFSLVACPHYLFDIVTLLGMSCISQTIFAVSLNVGSAFYLMGRSHSTKKWYMSKFENFPPHVKAVFPYIS
ncbi:hypothetical protein MLD38_002504 [Melastoma candidum]|uniref:Uncharacterized protein n=1 Tax=Melastoma candidum TaxID=119954 RepID=A0ACB9S3Y3_9MYRT|nr:hypothetical protein MLD38_002504 [Melastoma candidum]